MWQAARCAHLSGYFLFCSIFVQRYGIIRPRALYRLRKNSEIINDVFKAIWPLRSKLEDDRKLFHYATVDSVTFQQSIKVAEETNLLYSGPRTNLLESGKRVIYIYIGLALIYNNKNTNTLFLFRKEYGLEVRLLTLRSPSGNNGPSACCTIL